MGARIRAKRASCIASALTGLALTIASGTTHAEDMASGGWVARCDAVACKASLASASGGEALLLGRWTGNDGVSLGIATPRSIADRDRPIDIRVDDNALVILQPGRDYGPLERVEAFWITDTKPANTTLQAVLKARVLRISYLDMVGAPHDADFAVEGMAKVIAFFDEQQYRTPGSPSGIAPPRAVPAAPEISRSDLIIRMGVPERLMIRHRQASDCEDPNSPRLRSIQPLVGSLSKTAILYAIPCLVAANNTAFRIWVIETGEIGGIIPQYFAAYDRTFGWKGSDLFFNPTFDAAGGRLISVLNATPTGGCAYRGLWRWKDYAFAMEEFRFAADCSAARSTADLPRIFPAN